MAQDYNIYLHASTPINEAKRRTIPYANETSEVNIDNTPTSSSVLDNFTKVQSNISSFASQGFNGVIGAGVSALGKVAPWVVVAYEIIRLVDKVTDFALTSVSEYTGHFQYAMNYNNFKAGIQNVLQPVSYAKRQIELQLAIDKKNIEIEQNRTLVGSATLRNIRIGI